MQFENGKIHDVLFLGMPKLEHDTALYSIIALARNERHIFLPRDATQSRGENDTLNQAAVFAGTKMFRLSLTGITAADWKAAFGVELGSLADCLQACNGRHCS